MLVFRVQNLLNQYLRSVHINKIDRISIFGVHNSAERNDHAVRCDSLQ